MMFPLDWYNEFLTDISIFILRILKFIHSTAARWSCKPIIGKIILATYKAYMSALIIHMHNLLLATLPCLKWALSSLLLYTEDGRGTWMVSVQLKQRRQKWNQSILVLLPCHSALLTLCPNLHSLLQHLKPSHSFHMVGCIVWIFLACWLLLKLCFGVYGYDIN